MTEQSELVGRVRSLLSDEMSVREVSMFGGRALMVDDKLALSASKDGGLLVRVAADRDDELSSQQGASHAVMGRDRSMGPGWITVTRESIASDERLAFWVGVAMEHNRTVGSTADS